MAIERTSQAAAASGRARTSSLQGLLAQREVGILAALVVIFVIFWILAGSNFVNFGTWGSIVDSAAELGIVVLGVTGLMITGEFDLSVGANYAFTAMVAAILITDHWPTPIALLLGVVLGAFIGLLNGLLTVYLDIPSFITTLGTFLFWSGITLLATGGGMPVSDFNSSGVLNALGGTLIGQFRWEAVWWLVLAVVTGLLLHRTAFGNWMYATGGQRRVAQAVGVPVDRVRVLAFVGCGVTAALAGMMSFAHLYSMAPSYGQDLELEAIAAAVVGGCSLFGGVGSIIGALVGTLLLSMLDVGLVLAGASSLWYETFVGIIVIAAVAMHIRVGKWSQLLQAGGRD